MPLFAASQSNQIHDPLFTESEDRFRKLFLSSHDALFVTTSTATEFIDVNPRACLIFGYSRRELLSLPPSRILPWNGGAFDWRHSADKGPIQCTPCRHKSGRMVPYDLSVRTIKVGRKPCMLVVASSGKPRELAESIRKNSAFARFLNAVAVGVAEAPTIEHAIRFCIHQICDFACWPLAHARLFAQRITNAHVPADIWHFGLHARFKSRTRALASKPAASDDWYSRVTTTGRPFIAEDLTQESDFAVKQTARGLGLKSALLIPILVGREVVGVLEFFSHEAINLDGFLLEVMVSLGERLGRIIEHKRAERSVQSLSTRLFHVQDDERRRLARELHDTTAQHIAAIIMDLNVIARKPEALDADARTALSECISLSRQSLHDIRTFSYLLHPPMLDELGLVSALRVYIEGFSQRSGMHVRFEAPDSYTKLPADLEVTVFHVVQEGLTNAHRHSGSSWASVRMCLDATELKVSVENETTAELLFKKNPVQPARMGVGTRSMQERVQHFGGQLALHSDQYRTVLAAVLPLSQAVKGADA